VFSSPLVFRSHFVFMMDFLKNTFKSTIYDSV